MEQNTTIAKQRWLILKKALLSKRTSDIPCPASIRSHNGVALFQVTIKDVNSGVWLEYKHEGSPPMTALIKKTSSILSTEDLFEGDNTGNVCIWASEQVMARYCVLNIDYFKNKSVIEIGGGSSCLAGLFVAKYGDVKKVVLSDGNTKAVVNVDNIVKENFYNKINKLGAIEVAKFCWDNENNVSRFATQFDFVLCADCLFKDDIREQLVFAIYKLLKPEGQAIIFAPHRGNSLNNFIDLAKRLFGDSAVELIQKYDEKVWHFHLSNLSSASYDENIHYPYFIKLTKKIKTDPIITAASSA